jgi:hypothetical protein
MTSHHNAHATPSPGPNGKWGWDCANCGARGSYRYGSETAAEKGAEHHNKTARNPPVPLRTEETSMSKGPHGHDVVKRWQVQGNLTVLLEASGNIVLRRDRLPKITKQDGLDAAITNVAALADALYMAVAERGVREAREALGR